MKKRTIKTYPVPKVTVSGKYEVIIKVVSDTGKVSEVTDAMWIFKDDENSRSTDEVVKLVRLLEPYKPIKAEEMNTDGVIGVYQAMIEDARDVVDLYRKSLEDHNKKIGQALLEYFNGYYSEKWDDSWEWLLECEEQRDQYMERSKSSYRQASAFLDMMHEQITGERMRQL